MTNPIIKLVNAETGEEIEREMTAQELTQWEADNALDAEREAIKAETEAQKAADKAALLARLGLTQDEAKLLLS
jgi:hypothetical protein